MRIYKNFKEALPEIKRDLAEMGIRVHPQTYQDKFVGDNPDFETRELQNYIYTVMDPKAKDLEPTQPWAAVEWEERMRGISPFEDSVNPGTAWNLRSNVWKQFLQPDGRFAYTYSERLELFEQVLKVIARLKEDQDSRQLYIGIWLQSDNYKLGGISRIPCSLGYYIQCRRGLLNLTYLQRSADFVTHFINDIYLAHLLQKFVADQANIALGSFTHWIGSLHIFAKDVAGVF